MEPRDGILKAAQVVFTRHGFRQTAMAMVAAEAGLSRQALYHHFASKEALFAKLIDELHEAALAAARDASARVGGGAAEAVTRVMMAYHSCLMSRAAGSPYAAELVEESGRQCGVAVAAFGRKFEKEIEGVIDRYARAGSFKLRAGLSPRDLTEMLIVASKGVKSAYAGEGEAKYARAFSRMVDVICAGAARPAGKSAKGIQRTRTARRVAR
jgi:AcrR family transcriptional regulator